MTTKRLNSLFVVVALILGCSTSWAAQAHRIRQMQRSAEVFRNPAVDGLRNTGTNAARIFLST